MPQLNDHDLLIQLDARLRGIEAKLDAHLLDNGETIKDHEARLRRLEMWGAIAVGGIMLIELLARTGVVQALSG